MFSPGRSIPRMTVLACATLLTAMAMSGCGSTQRAAVPASASTTAASKSAASSSPKALTKVTEQLPTHDIGYLPSILAAEKGYFADEGLQVDMPVMTAQVAIPALVNKEIQFGVHASAEHAAYQGAPLKGIYYSYNVVTFEAVGAKEIKSYQDLRGKVLGIASPGSAEDQVIHLLLDREKVPISSVQIIPLGGGPQRAQALIGGQIQFTVENPDVAVYLQSQGFNILGSMRDIFPVPWAGFAVHQDTITQQPQMLKGWLRAHVRALKYIKSNPDDAANVTASAFNIDKSLALKAMDLLLPTISDDDPGGLTEAGLILKTQFDQQAMNLPGDPAELGRKVSDMSLLRQVQRDMGIHCTKGYQC